MAETPAPPLPDDLTFERAIEQLEGLVARMEDGKLPLEESLVAYQKGAQLIRFCESRLTAAQGRIAILEGDTLRDFSPDTK
jgi:exodeoxyribonuclease VII small subunit